MKMIQRTKKVTCANCGSIHEVAASQDHVIFMVITGEPPDHRRWFSPAMVQRKIRRDGERGAVIDSCPECWINETLEPVKI
jgi:hypothetical protein